MKNRFLALFGILATSFVAHSIVFAQDGSAVSSAAGDLYVISAKAGGVNYVEGTAVAMKADGTSGRVIKGDRLSSGDVVETGLNGRVELLLNPGSFARIGNNSRFELTTTDLDDLRLNLLSGSAIFEVFASDDFKVTVKTPSSEIYLIKSGVYRVDVDSNGTAKLEVWRGRAETSDDVDGKLKKGRTATLNGGEAEVTKFDRGDRDSFEQWSRDRAELIAKANKKLESKVLGPTLLSGFRADSWDCWQSVGLWVYNPAYSTYSFLPFGYGWRSPYGFGFRTSTGICYNPSYFYGRPYTRIYGGRRTRTQSGGGTTGTTTRRTVPQTNIDRGTRNRTPPFQRMQNTGSVKVRNRAPMSAGSGFPPLGRSSRRRSTTTSSGSSAPRTSKSEPATKQGSDN